MYITGGLIPGQELLEQCSQCPPPDTWLPFSSTFVEHHGVESPSIVVQVSWILPPKTKGKTQFPQLPDSLPVPEPDVPDPEVPEPEVPEPDVPEPGVTGTVWVVFGGEHVLISVS